MSDERLAAAVKTEDGFFATFMVSPYSRHIVRWAARRGMTPNQVTTLSMILAAIAALAFATGERIGLVTGAVLVQVAFTADCVDGQLARYTGASSPLGAWLDTVSDRLKEFVVYTGLAVGGARTGVPGIWLLAMCALALQALRHQADFAYNAQHPGAVTTGGSDLEGPPLAAAGVRTATALEGSWLKWLKRIAVLPIGERFALISVTAAVWGPQVTFTALLVWGSVAAVYMVTGRVLRSLAAGEGVRPSPAPRPAGPGGGGGVSALVAQRDDGPVAVAVRRMSLPRVPGVPLAVAAITILAAGLAADGAATGVPSLVAVAVFVALGALTAAARRPSSVRWAVPPLLHTGEYGIVIVLAWRNGLPPAAFGLLAALAYHHYELAYLRNATRGPRAVDLLAGGWDGRSLLVVVAAAAGLLPATVLALAVWCGGLFIAAGVSRTVRIARGDPDAFLGGDPGVRASASEPAGGAPGVRASASEPAGGDPGVRASASEPAGGDLA